MDENDLNELASKMAFGDKITFKHNFEKWRSDLNIAHHNSLTIRSKSLSPSTSHSSSFSDDEEYSNTKVCVMKILQQHNIGCKILEMYETTKEITPEHRNLMISIIVEYFQSKDMHMETQTSYNIESQILKIFPNEKLSFYRTGRRGKIYTKYINNKRLLKSFKKPSEHRPNNEVYVPQGEDEILTKRLRYDDLPAEEFYSAWSACAKLRFNQIKNDCQTMGEIFTLWPQYKETLGVKLIDIDFNQMFETNYNTLDWKENFINIFKQLKHGAKARDVNFKQMMDSIDVDDLDNDSKNTYLKILWCLHYILFQTRKEVQSETDGKRKYKTFSVRDSQYAFIYISETMQSLENHVAELQKKKQPIQPFILGLGDMKSLQVSTYFVYLDGQYLHFTSFVRAVDICFKAIQLFNLEYPLACRPMWIFIEQFLYKLNKSTEKVSKVSLLINELEKY